ncbi:MAG TPA: BBE domain-containing protein, partial [Longimicrobiales bacterium]|nr:BBE domain-containing protein [Longimicrobiales bacterium]
PDDAERTLKPARDFGSPIMDTVGPMPYEAVNAMLDGGFPRGALNHWKSSFLAELADGAIDTMIERFAECPAPMSSLLLEHFHGEATRVDPTATAFPHRTPGYNFAVLTQWPDPATTEEAIRWSRATHDAMSPFFGDGRYVNYLDDDEGQAAVRAAYGPNYPRLVELKRKYDPTNFFRMNQNVEP